MALVAPAARLRDHTPWLPSQMQARLIALRLRAERRYQLATWLLKTLFFAGAALAALGLLYQAHDQHPALLPYIAGIVLVTGYFAFTLGTGLAPPELTLKLWREDNGAVPLEADEAERLKALVRDHADVAGVVREWEREGHELQQRDLEAIEASVLAAREANAATITARIPISPALLDTVDAPIGSMPRG